MAAALLPTAKAYAATKTVANETALRAAVTSPGTVQLTADIQLTGSALEIPAGADIVLTGNFKLIGENLCATIIIDDWARLTLSGPTVTHRSTSSSSSGKGVLVKQNGELVLTSGKISGNADRGVISYGNFIMYGGKITGNHEGGVFSFTFTMRGGEISGNTGGGVYNGGTFTMSGGTISHNKTDSAGGGVAMGGWTSFTMTGGEISGNTASWGGGISVTATGTPINTRVSTGYEWLVIGASAKFSDNVAGHGGFADRDPSLDTFYTTNISCTQWTAPFKQGYNNYDIYADYGEPAVILAVQVSSAGNGTAATNAKVALAGDTVTLSATPNAGYQFDHWTVDKGAAVLSSAGDAGATFTMPDGDVGLTAYFVVAFAVNVKTDGHGTAAAYVTSAAAGKLVTLSAVPASGYQFDH